MKKIICLVLFLSLCVGASFSFDLKKIMETAPAGLYYPSASAVILKDYIEYEYKPDGSVVQIEHEVIKILDFDGVERFEELEYVYNSELTDMQVEEAKVLNEGDDKAEKAVVTESAPFNKIPPLDSVKIKKIKFQNIYQGAIIEFKIKSTIKNPEMKGAFWGVSFFQDYEPILESDLVIKTPPGKPIFYKLFGNYKAAPSIKYDREKTIYGWKSVNNPVVVKEAAAPSVYARAAQLRFSSVASWDAAGVWYYKLVEKATSKSMRVRTLADEAASSAKTGEEKIKQIHDYIVKNFDYAGLDFNHIGFTPRKTDEVIKHKIGNSVDLTALFISALKIYGITAYPALTATRGYCKFNGSVVDLSQFNYALAALPVKGGYKFIDVSSRYNSVDNIPVNIQGQPVFIAVKEGARFSTVPVNAAQFNKEDIFVEALIEDDGSIKESVRIREFGSNGSMLRRFFSNFDKFYQTFLISVLTKSIADKSTLIGAYISDIDKINEPFDISFTFEAGKFVDFNQDLPYFTLPLFPVNNLVGIIEDDPSERVSPVVVSSTILSNKNIRIFLPEGVTPAGLPSTRSIKNSVGQYQYFCEHKNNKITASSKLEINKLLVEKADYGKLRDLIMSAVNTEREVVVLKKNK